MYVFESISSITTAQSFLIIGFLELGVYMYVCGYNNVFLDIKMMVGKRPLEPYLFITWVITFDFRKNFEITRKLLLTSNF